MFGLKLVIKQGSGKHVRKAIFQKVLRHSFSIPVKVNFWDGTTEVYGVGEPKTTITFHESIPAKDILSNASIALGEAYMDQKIEVEGSLEALIASAYENAESFMRKKIFANTCLKCLIQNKKVNKMFKCITI